MTRIEYKKENNYLVNKNMLTNNHETLDILINRSTFLWSIVCVSTGQVFEGKSKSIPEAKRYVKNTLRSLGVSFADEVRKKKIIDIK